LRMGLERAVGKGHVITGTAVLDSPYGGMRPSPRAIARVGNPREVSKVVRLANRHRVGLVFGDSFGSIGKSRLPRQGELVVDLRRMNKIRETRVLDLFSTAEPAATLGELNSALKVSGFFFPPARGLSDSSTLGRSVISNSGSPRACGYGRARNYVLRMKMVTPTGDMVELGSRTLKNSSGLQIERFVAGSDGLFGFPVELSVAVRPRPEESRLVVGSFSSLKDAIAALSGAVLSDLLPVSIEIALGIPLPICPGGECWREDLTAVIVLVEGHPETVGRGLDSAGRAFKEAGAISITRTSDEKLIEEIQERMSGLPACGGHRSVPFVVSIGDAGRVLEEIGILAQKRHFVLRMHAYFLEGDLRCSLAVSDAGGKTGQEIEREIRSLIAGGWTSDATPGRSLESRRDRDTEVCLLLKQKIDPNQVFH
jgi:FAD/FMN-containing dehydrogenase